MLNRIELFLTGLLALSQLFERLLIDVVSALTPWATPIVPAWLVFSNLQILGAPPWVALSAAVVVECLGLAAINTVLALWQYNETRREKDKAAPVGVALAAGGFYIVTVVVVNAVLDIDMNGATVKTLAYAMLSLLSVVAGVVIAVRAQHSRRLAEIREDKAEARERRRELRADRKIAAPSLLSSGPQSAPPVTRNDAATRALRRQQWEAVQQKASSRNGAGPMTVGEIRGMFPDDPPPERTAYNWLSKLEN